MATSSTGPKKATAGTGSTNQGAKTTQDTSDLAGEITQALTDAAHAAIGFAVIGWNKTQVRRRELLKELNVQRHQWETQLDGAREQVASAIRQMDARIQPVRQDIDGQLDKFSERLPEQVRDVVASARKVLRDTEHQVRQAVGAL